MNDIRIDIELLWESEDSSIDCDNLPANRVKNDESGGKRFYVLPSKNEVCGRCRGTGVHNHPAFSNGFSRNDEFVDEDFLEDYWSGVHDVVCEDCNGWNVVPVPDEERFTDLDRRVSELWEQYLQSEADYRKECAQERRMGC
jgi:hypothetical protein